MAAKFLLLNSDFKVLLLTYKALHGLAYLHIRYGHKTQAS